LHPFGIITTWGSASTRIKSSKAFEVMAEFVQDNTLEEMCMKEKIAKTMAQSASSKRAFKGVNRAAHEAYQ
jgi:hypothetical protein